LIDIILYQFVVKSNKDDTSIFAIYVFAEFSTLIFIELKL